MIKKLCLFILLVIFSNSALAEYYLVYTPPQCVDCVDPFPLPVDYKSCHHRVYKHARTHHVARHYKKVYRECNTCGECENCICGDGYAISTSQPRYYGEHCTTYEDEIVGREMQSGY